MGIQHNLNEAFARTVGPPHEIQFDYHDAKLPGFSLRVFRSGNKSWVLRYWGGRLDKNGKRKREFVALGRWPGMTCAEAREKVLGLLAERRANKVDPATQRDAARAANSFTELAALYMTKKGANKKSGAEDARTIAADLLPRLGKIKAAEVTQADINATLDVIVERGSKVQANRARTLLGAIFKLGMKRGVIEPGRSPCAYVEAMPGGKEKPRERVLSDEEIKAVWPACDSDQLGDAARLAILTGQREGEILGMTFAELDLKTGVWNLPGSRSKNGHPNSTPLVGQSLAILRALEAGKPEGAIRVFPSGSKSSVARLVRRLRAATGAADITFHDFRRTFGTKITEMDWRFESIVPKLLNHSKRGVTSTVYDHNDYREPRREVLRRWDAQVKKWVFGKPKSKVIEGDFAQRA